MPSTFSDGASRRGNAAGSARAIPALIAVLVAALALAAAAAARSGGAIEVQVTECSTGTEQGCETEQTAPSDSSGEPTGQSGTSTGGGSAAGEVHSIDLNSGSSRVTVPESGESITLDLNKRDRHGDRAESVTSEPTGGVPDPDKDRPERAEPDTSGAVNMPVSTSGGKFTPGAAFDYVSADEALSSFAVPPFLLPIYISAGRAYDVPWNVLAAINQIETDFGRLGACAVSYAGARGWMQFMPGTWEAYGVDASGDGTADPCNPVDAIYAAARYLDASGASTDLRGAVFAYNHANWYVDRVLTTAGIYGSLPTGLVTETGSLAYGRFPVSGQVSYGDDFRAAQEAGQRPVGLRIFPRERARAVATQEVTVTRILLGPGLARGMRRGSGAVIRELAARGPQRGGPSPSLALGLARLDYAIGSLSGASQLGRVASGVAGALYGVLRPLAESFASGEPIVARVHRSEAEGPSDSGGRRASAPANFAGRDDGLPRGFAAARAAGIGVEVRDPAGNRYRYSGLAGLARSVRVGETLAAAEAIGPLRFRKGGEADGGPMVFETIAAGGSPVDPRPLVDGYRLQEAANYYHAAQSMEGNPFVPGESFAELAVGAVKGTQAQLARRVLSDPGISIYECGRQDIARGIVDARVLGALLYLREAGLTMTVTSLRCGHSYYTAGGSISAHSYGAAMDIAAFNGQSVLGNQGPGSLTAQAIKLLMALDGSAQPSQLISLMNFGGPSFALSDHHDHLHVGYSFEPSLGLGRSGNALSSVSFDGSGSISTSAADGGAAEKSHERRLSERLGQIENPSVRRADGAGSLTVEGEGANEREEAERLAQRKLPIQLTPLSFGAQSLAVSVPSRAKADEAYALGVVDGSSRGWSNEQVVVLAYRDGIWSLTGPPRGSNGKVVNPPVTDLATNARGQGYAVGDKGAVVRLRGSRAPVLLKRERKADLRSVAVAPDGASAIATGLEGGSVLRIASRRQSVERVAPGATLTAAAIGARKNSWLAGTRDGEPILISGDGSSWSAVPLGGLGVSPEAAVRLTSVAERDGTVLIGGAIAGKGTIGSPLELPFAALRDDGVWRSHCAVDPALAPVAELGAPTARACDDTLGVSGAGRGAASAVALGRDAALVASGDSIQVLEKGSRTFEPVPAGVSQIRSLALDAGGNGWAIGPDGQLVRVGPRSGGRASQERSTQLPMPGDGLEATVAADPSGDRALAISEGTPAVLALGEWRTGSSLGLGVRALAWTRPGSAWAIDDTGALLELNGSEWSQPAYGWAGSELRRRLVEMAGSGALKRTDLAGAGLNALAFRSPAEGFAVGAGGLTLRYDGFDGWESEPRVTTADLHDVAASPRGAIAVGARGTLLERGDGRWFAVPQVALMVGGEVLTAATAMADGTLLAAGAGAILVREPGDDWRLSELPPLGEPIQKVAGYRGDDGELRAVALVRAAGRRYLLAGSAGGWTPVEPPAGMTVTDFAPRPGTRSVWAVGAHGGGPALATLALEPGQRSAGDDDERWDEASGAELGEAGRSLLGAVGESFEPDSSAPGATNGESSGDGG